MRHAVPILHVNADLGYLMGCTPVTYPGEYGVVIPLKIISTKKKIKKKKYKYTNNWQFYNELIFLLLPSKKFWKYRCKHL